MSSSHENEEKTPIEELHRPSGFLDEIIHEILGRLPVKSLLQFKCVCKSWNSMISNPGLKLIPNDDERRQKLILKGRDRYSFLSDHSFFSIDRRLLFRRLPDPFVVNDRDDPIHVLGQSFNGLVLLGVRADIFLWNPTIRCCKKVLELQLLAQGTNFMASASGLCYNASTGEFKAVISLLENKRSTLRRVFLAASLKEKRWECIRWPEESGPITAGPSMGGRLFFGVFRPGSSMDLEPWLGFPNQIVYFDAMTEKFVDLEMPEGTDNRIAGLGIVRGCLCMTRSEEGSTSSGGGGNSISVLIMEEHGGANASSWVRLFRIRVDCRRMIPTFCTQKGEVVVVLGCKMVVLACDVVEETKRKIKLPDRYMFSEGIPYIEGVASPEEYVWIESQHSGLGEKERIKWLTDDNDDDVDDDDDEGSDQFIVVMRHEAMLSRHGHVDDEVQGPAAGMQIVTKDA